LHAPSLLHDLPPLVPWHTLALLPAEVTHVEPLGQSDELAHPDWQTPPTHVRPRGPLGLQSAFVVHEVSAGHPASEAAESPPAPAPEPAPPEPGELPPPLPLPAAGDDAADAHPLFGPSGVLALTVVTNTACFSVALIWLSPKSACPVGGDTSSTCALTLSSIEHCGPSSYTKTTTPFPAAVERQSRVPMP
jgi:hypothetical protein